MKAQTKKVIRIALILPALLAANVTPVHAQFNGWANNNSGKWEVGTNWTRGTPPGTNDVYDNLFTGITVTIDATTSGSYPGTMTANTVALESAVILELNNAGTNVPLHLLHDLDIAGDSYPQVIVTNSALQVDGVLYVSDIAGTASSFELDSGWARFGSISMGNPSGGGGNGHLYLNGGTLRVLGSTTLGVAPSGGGDVEMDGGIFIQTNSPIVLGSQGIGGFNAFGGIVQALSFQIGNVAGSQGSLSVSGGTVLVSSNILIGNSLVTSPCSVSIYTNISFGVTNAILCVTNASHTAYIDVASNGSLTLNGGLLQVDNLILTNGGSFTSIAGSFTNLGPLVVDNGSSMTLASGTVVAPANFTVGSVAGSSGSVSMAGGALIVTNAPLLLGPVGVGQMSVASNSTVTAQIIKLGSSVPGAAGTLIMNDNSNLRVTSLLSVNSIVSFDLPGVDVVVDGTGATLNLGDDSPGRMNVTSPNASQTWENMNIGYNANGTYLQSGGVTMVNNSVIVGSCVTNGSEVVGSVTLSGGALYVTNSTHTAVLVVRNGTFVLGSGATLVADNLIITNACAQFQNNGGTLTVNPANITLAPNLDADGDGVSNGAETAAGTDPLNPASYFHILSVTRSGNNASVSWTTVGGHSYHLQSSVNTGSIASASFTNVSPLISITGTGEGTTSYQHTNGGTNQARFYRVKLGP